MSDDLRRRLERVPLPAEHAAEERARAVVLAAAAERAEASRGRPRWRGPAGWRPARAGLALAVVAAALAVALTPPGEALGDFVRDLVRPAATGPARPALDALPAAGRLLVTGPGGAWVVFRDGSRRRLGAYDDASWSPRGRFAAVTRGRQLLAVEPDGAVRWALARRGTIRLPRWAPPDGFRIAYLEDSTLRVVAGDGSGDRLVARGIPRVAPAWRPGPAHQLAHVASDGRVVARAADAGPVRWRARIPGRPLTLEWSPDGARLLVVTTRGATVLDAAGRVRRRLPVPAGSAATAGALSPDGRRVALARRDAARAASAVEVASARGGAAAPRTLLEGPGAFTALTWSPDGRWLLASWPAADQWVFLRGGNRAGVAAFSGIAGHFDPRPRAPRGFPMPQGWCCAAGGARDLP